MIKIEIGQAAEQLPPVWAETLTSLVASVAWPVAAVSIAFAFRPAITTLLSKVSKLAYGDASMELHATLDNAEEIAKLDPQPSSQTPLDDKLAPDLLSLPPAAVVMLEWREIDVIIQELLTSLGSSIETVSRGPRWRQLFDTGVVSPSTLSIVRDLLMIRNQVTHERLEPSAADAVRFYQLAQRVKADLRTAIDNLPNRPS